MKKKIIVGSILSVLILLLTAFMSPVSAQSATAVSTSATSLTPCSILLAQVIAAGTLFLITLGLTVPVGGSTAWLLLVASGALGADAYALYQAYKALCGGESTSSVTGPISVSGLVSSAPLCNCNARSR